MVGGKKVSEKQRLHRFKVEIPCMANCLRLTMEWNPERAHVPHAIGYIGRGLDIVSSPMRLLI